MVRHETRSRAITKASHGAARTPLTALGIARQSLGGWLINRERSPVRNRSSELCRASTEQAYA